MSLFTDVRAGEGVGALLLAANVIVAQFWSFANDIYTNERGKRL